MRQLFAIILLVASAILVVPSAGIGALCFFSFRPGCGFSLGLLPVLAFGIFLGAAGFTLFSTRPMPDKGSLTDVEIPVPPLTESSKQEMPPINLEILRYIELGAGSVGFFDMARKFGAADADLMLIIGVLMAKGWVSERQTQRGKKYEVLEAGKIALMNSKNGATLNSAIDRDVGRPSS